VKLSRRERRTVLIHHGPNTMEVADYLGFIVAMELTDGSKAVGRVDAVDDHFVYLGRTERHPKVALHDVKKIDMA
jgi:small nuclear ribonucleoprotein (snRNP)-like protein